MENNIFGKLQLGLEMAEIDFDFLDQEYVFNVLIKHERLSFVNLVGQLPDEHLVPLLERLSEVKLDVPSYVMDLTTKKRLYAKTIVSVLADYLVWLSDSTTFH